MTDDTSALEVAIRERLRELRVADDHLRAQEEGVQRKRVALAAEASELRTALRVVQELTGVDVEAAERAALTIDTQGSIATVAARIIAERGGEADAQTITDDLLALGRVDSRTPRGAYAVVFSILRRHRFFEKAGRGRFRLAPSIRTVALGIALRGDGDRPSGSASFQPNMADKAV